MLKTAFRHRAAGSALVAVALAAAAGAAGAQPIGEITVEAPRSIHVAQGAQVDRHDPAAQIQVTTIKTQVGYGDLDLAKTADADTLRARVKIMANNVCDRLDKLYPQVTDGSCVANSIARASVRVEAAIAAAEKR